MNPLEMMLRSGVMRECRPISRWRERAYVRYALREVMPEDKTWQVALLALAIAGGFAVLFVRWWLCV